MLGLESYYLRAQQQALPSYYPYVAQLAQQGLNPCIPGYVSRRAFQQTAPSGLEAIFGHQTYTPQQPVVKIKKVECVEIRPKQDIRLLKAGEGL